MLKFMSVLSLMVCATGIVAQDASEPPLQATCPELQKPVMYFPWRERYVANTSIDQPKECVFCRIKGAKDRKEFILARFKHHMVMLNLYPYSRGHLLIVPYDHVKRIDELSVEAQNELIWLIAKSVSILEKDVHADGVNVGMNLGRAANASIPDHMHVQLVPRFNKESRAFLHLVSDISIIFWDMNKLFEELRSPFQELASH